MSRFDIQNTRIQGVKLITRNPVGDNRGWLERVFCSEELSAAGWVKPIAQINRTSTTKHGTVRGMHFQKPPFAEMKIVSCLHGKILDVALDLRTGSPTFLQHFSAELSEDNHVSMLLPEGVAHGFQALSNNVEMLYLHSALYAPNAEDSLHPEDPMIGIHWPLPLSVISDSDKGKDFISREYRGLPL